MAELPRYDHVEDPSVKASDLGLGPEDIRKVIAYAAQVMYATQNNKGLSGVELAAFTALYEDAYSSPQKQEKHRSRQFPGKTARAITDAFTRLNNKNVPIETRRVLDDKVDPMEPFTQYFFSRASKLTMAESAREHYDLMGNPLEWDGVEPS